LIWIFFTTEDTEHTEYFLGFEEGDFGQPGWSFRASTNPSSETGRRFLFSVSSVPSVVRKSGFELDFEHTSFVVKKNPDRKPSAREATPLRNEVKRAHPAQLVGSESAIQQIKL